MKDFHGYPLASKNHQFVIQEMTVQHILVLEPKLIRRVVSKKVMKKYDQLIKKVTELLIVDDEDGSSCRQALNLIEKFRLEIKVKYREYLKEKELKKMAEQLKMMKKLLNRKEMEMRTAQLNESMGKSR